PGLIVGPHDPTDRFTYWPRRIAQGGVVLAPGNPAQRAEFIDARDLAAWIVRLVEAQRTGTYNATGPAVPLTMRKTLDACRDTLNSDASFTWVSERFLLDNDVAPFTEMPLWLPEEAAGLNAVSVDRAIAAGLVFRPLAETILDTFAWDAARPADAPRREGIGLTRERERELLEKWRGVS
ncbi:MAG: epimerase, partial [Ardenticatenaceae bacterium]